MRLHERIIDEEGVIWDVIHTSKDYVTAITTTLLSVLTKRFTYEEIEKLKQS